MSKRELNHLDPIDSELIQWRALFHSFGVSPGVAHAVVQDMIRGLSEVSVAWHPTCDLPASRLGKKLLVSVPNSQTKIFTATPITTRGMLIWECKETALSESMISAWADLPKFEPFKKVDRPLYLWVGEDGQVKVGASAPPEESAIRVDSKSLPEISKFLKEKQ